MNNIVEKKIIKQGTIGIAEVKGASLVETQKKNFDLA